MDLRPLNFFSWWTHFGLFKVHLQIALKALHSLFFIMSLGPFANFANRQFHSPHISICYICLRFQPAWPQVWFPRRARPSLCLDSQTSLCIWDHQSPNTLCVRVQIPFWSRKLVHKYKAPQTQNELFTLIQIVCIGSGIQRICCVPNSIYIRSGRSLSSMKVDQCNTDHFKSSAPHKYSRNTQHHKYSRNTQSHKYSRNTMSLLTSDCNALGKWPQIFFVHKITLATTLHQRPSLLTDFDTEYPPFLCVFWI